MTIKFKNWLLKHWRWIILIIVAAGFFIGTASFNYYTQADGFVKWLSPDESANYNFTKLYAQEKRLEFFEKYNLLAADVMHPRSFRSDQGLIKPVSFLGLVLIYGTIAGLTTYKILPYLTPIFAALGLIFYFLLIKEVFGKRNALISAIAAASLPPLIYYSARSMFHNVLFVVLLIISFYFAVIMVKTKKLPASPRLAGQGGLELQQGRLELGRGQTNRAEVKFKILKFLPDVYAALAGAILGLAVIVRSAELIWLIPAWLALWLFNIKKVGLIKLLIFLAFLAFSLLPALFWNQILYRSIWRGGYDEMNQSILNIAGAGQAIVKSGGLKTEVIKNNLTQIKNNFFHFGFLPGKSFKMLYFYFAAMFYWLFWPALLGFFWLLKKIDKWKRRHFCYLTVYAIIFFILLFYYGSWDFHDNPDPKSHTIGNSYARYWLPIYLGALPLASFFLIKLSNLLRKKILIYGCRVLMIIIIFFISIKFVLFGSAEGLVQSAKKLRAARQDYNQILRLTEPRSVIITEYHDKLLFPERKVIVGLFNDGRMIEQYAILTKYLPVYYYNFTLPEKDYNYLNDKRLAKFNLQINQVAKVAKDFTLYKLSLRGEATTTAQQFQKQ